MSQQTLIRPERPEDAAAISRLTERAFRSHPHSRHAEQHIIQALRQAGALSLSLVAEIDGQIVGHIAFSPVQFSDGSPNWHGLGPLAVAPEFQRQGIGQTLAQAGLDALRELGAEGCVVLGEPEFYGRFGFQSRAGCVLEGVPAEYFLSLHFGPAIASGKAAYHEAFSVLG